MLSFDEALAKIVQAAPRLATESVDLDAALGRVLAETLSAAAPLPPHDYSSMDGYALDTRTLTGNPPWAFVVEGESRTGHSAPRLSPHSVCRIFTGAPMPHGADAVVMQENVTRDGDRIRLSARATPGDNVRYAGEDLAEGAAALEKGTRLGPYQLGLAAALDRGALLVSRRPRVTIVATGDELRKPGSVARPASIPESNSIVISALAVGAGAVTRVTESTSDDLEATRQALGDALDVSDLVVTIGGVSVGDYDVVRPALEAAGVHLDFYKVAIKPGKPLTLGVRGETVVLGLPGNPVSAQITFALFGLPLLRQMQGDRRAKAVPRAVRLGAPIRQKLGRRGFYGATLDGDVATPLSGQSSGSTVSLARADALVIVPEDSTGYETGDAASALLLGEL